jgi:diguanylate cyclase (GGDEF)-like protein/PAS domain S-box-containing protein
MQPRSVQRLVSGSGLALAIALLAGIGYRARWYTTAEVETSGWVEHTHLVIEELLSAGQALERADRAAGEGVEAVAAAFHRLQASITDDPEAERRLEELAPAFDGWLAAARAGARPRGAGGTETERLADTLRGGFRALIDTERRQLADRVARRARDAGRARSRATVIALIGIGLIGLAGALFLHERRVRQRAEDAVRAQHALLESVIEGTSDSVFAKDATGRYLLANTSAARLVGKTPAEVRGKDDRELLAPEIAALVMQRDQEVMQSAEGRTFEQRMTVGGVKHTMLVTVGPHRDPQRRVVGVVGIATDITARKQAEEARLAEMNLLLRLGEMLQACRTVDEAYQVLEQLVPRFFPETSGTVYLFHASRDHLEPHVVWGPRPPPAQAIVVPGTLGAFPDPSATELRPASSPPLHVTAAAISIPPDDCWALRRGQPHLVERPSAGIPCRHVQPPPEPAEAVLCHPLVAHGEMLGVLHLRVRGAMEPPVVQRTAVVAEQIAMAVANLQLHDKLRNQSIRDPLTSLFNRRYTEETLVRELHRARRSGRPVAVLAIDIDHFKRFNDTFGHDAGDHVLREVAALITQQTRGGDVTSRMGGEELLVILPDAHLDDARARAEQIRTAVAALEVQHQAVALGLVTVSVGVAVFPTHGLQPDDLLRAADAALYGAKRDGRDRVVVADGAAAASSSVRAAKLA